MTPARVVSAAVLVNTVVIQIITYAYRPTLAYAALDAGGVVALLGVMSGMFAVPALILAIPAGRLVDTAGERLLAVGGATLLTVSLGVALLFPTSLVALMLATLLLGIAHLGCIVGQQTLVANRARSGRSDAAFGWYTLAASIGQAFGPLLLALPGPDALRPPVQAILFICTGLTLLLLASAFLFPRHGVPAQQLRVSDGGPWRAAGRNLRERGTIRALVAGGIALASVDITLVYWPAVGDERGLAPAVVSAMLVTRAIATMASRGLLGWTTRRWGRRTVMTATLGTATVALAATAFPLGVGWLIAAAVVYGFGIGACQPITMSWLGSLAAAGQKGAILSLRLVGNRFAQSTVPVLAGIIAAPFGGPGVIVVLACALGVATWAGAAVPDAEEAE